MDFLLEATSSIEQDELLHRNILDPIDSIMMLAEQASQKSPIHRFYRSSGSSPRSPGLPSKFVDYGSYFNQHPELLQQGPPFEAVAKIEGIASSFRNSTSNGFLATMDTRQDDAEKFISSPRRRAMSEPYIKLNNSNSKLPGRPCITVPGSNYTTDNIYSLTVPELLDQYSSIYNKHGRIGIYTRDERDAIIHRFQEKKRRRIWRKKVRYNCRKNLADSRIRIKGRFVRAVDLPSATKESDGDGKDISAEEEADGGTEYTTMDTMDEEIHDTGKIVGERKASQVQTKSRSNSDMMQEDGGENENREAAAPHRRVQWQELPHLKNTREEEEDEDEDEEEEAPDPDEEAPIEGHYKRMRRHSIAY